jgi:hypothetical protein
LTVLTGSNVQVSEDGRLHTTSAEAACLIEILGLDAEDMVEYRMTWIGISPWLRQAIRRFIASSWPIPMISPI